MKGLSNFDNYKKLIKSMHATITPYARNCYNKI